jgi:hypothetical protein
VARAIRDLFIHDLGGVVSMHMLAEQAIARGVFPDNMLAGFSKAGAAAWCRKALKQKDETGLPLAKPLTSGDGAVWKQWLLMTYEEAAAAIERDASSVVADYRELRVLYNDCKQRFGRAPEIPELREIEFA